MELSKAQEFRNLLLTAIKNLQALKEILLEEKQLLQQADHTPESIEHLTQRKEIALNAIQEDINQRSTFFTQHQLSSDLEGVEALLTSLPANSAKALKQGWAQLVKLLEEVQEHNSFNARLINRANQHFDLLLNTYQASQRPSKVYNPTGGSGNLNTPRNLGSA